MMIWKGDKGLGHDRVSSITAHAWVQRPVPCYVRPMTGVVRSKRLMRDIYN